MQVLNLNLTILPSPNNGKYQVVKFAGDLDKAGLQSIQEKIDALVESFSQPYLVFDFSDLNFINSESIGFLTTIHSHLIKNNKSLVLIQAKANVKDVFTVIGLFTFISYYDSLAAFLEKIGSSL